MQILHGKRLRAIDADERAAAERELVDEYDDEFDNPYRAAERGLVDAVIAPEDDARACCATRSKCSRRSATSSPPRRHTNTPL